MSKPAPEDPAPGTPPEEAATPTPPEDPREGRPISFGRRMAVMLYESMLLVGVLFGAGLPVVLVLDDTPAPGNPLYMAWLLTAVFVYFGLFWTRAGQTPAMQAWKVRVEREDGAHFGWRDAALRYVGGLLGFACALLAARAAANAGSTPLVETAIGLATFMLAFAWALFDSRGRAWPDLVSGTRLVGAGARKRR